MVVENRRVVMKKVWSSMVAAPIVLTMPFFRRFFATPVAGLGD